MNVRSMLSRMSAVVVLKRTRRGYEEPGPPAQCPNGHPLRGPNLVLVGTQACSTCSGRGLGPHRAYSCTTCGISVYDPAQRPECSFVSFDGRAVPG